MPRGGETRAMERKRQAEQRVHPRLLNSPEAAIYLGVSETKLRELLERGEVSSVRIDGCVRFDVRRLDRRTYSRAPPREAARNAGRP